MPVIFSAPRQSATDKEEPRRKQRRPANAGSTAWAHSRRMLASGVARIRPRLYLRRRRRGVGSRGQPAFRCVRRPKKAREDLLRGQLDSAKAADPSLKTFTEPKGPTRDVCPVSVASGVVVRGDGTISRRSKISDGNQRRSGGAPSDSASAREARRGVGGHQGRGAKAQATADDRVRTRDGWRAQSRGVEVGAVRGVRGGDEAQVNSSWGRKDRARRPT